MVKPKMLKGNSPLFSVRIAESEQDEIEKMIQKTMDRLSKKLKNGQSLPSKGSLIAEAIKLGLPLIELSDK